MSEMKKDFMIEALNEIEDNYIEEAVAYKKLKFSVRYQKEFSVLAACFAIVILAGFAYRYMPIRSTEEVEHAEGAQYETLSEDVALEGAEQERYSYGVVFVPVEQGETKEVLTTDKNGQDGLAESDLCGYPVAEAMQTQQSSVNHSITSAKSRAEIINEATDAFRGTVTAKESYRTEGAIESVFTVLTVEVEEVYKGETVVGKDYKIYIPVGEVDGIATDNSLSGDLLLIEVGTKGTFIPQKTSATTGRGTTGTAEAYLSYADVADYYILNGVEQFVLEND